MASVIQFEKKKKQQRVNTARIDSAIFSDVRLSWAAKGIYAYLMATGAQIKLNELKMLAPNDLYLSLAIKELRNNGYVNMVNYD